MMQPKQVPTQSHQKHKVTHIGAQMDAEDRIDKGRDEVKEQDAPKKKGY